jgi:hypothetical protein
MQAFLQKTLGAVALTLAGFGAQAATLDVLPSSATPMVGSTFNVTILVSGLIGAGAPALADFDIDVHFDASRLGYVGFAWGDAVLGDQLDLAHLGSLAFADESQAGSGKVNYFEVSYDDSTLLNSTQAGSFGLLTLTFNALQAGGTPITLSVNSLGDVSGNALAVQLNGANVQVAPVPVPASLSLLASALLVAGGMGGRRRQ